MTLNVESNIEKAVGKLSPKMGREITAAREKMRAMIPRGYEMVYDNYNALVFAYCSNERPSGAQVSIAAMPRWVTLFFSQGAKLEDPKKLLLGSSKQTRFVWIESPRTLMIPEVQAFLEATIEQSKIPFSPSGSGKLVIKTYSEK